MVREKLEVVKSKIAEACRRARREPAEVEIIAVTKTHPIETILEAKKAGINNIGENRIQEAEAKFAEIGDTVNWHLVGHLQRNKVKKALEIFTMIQSLDSLVLVEEIERRGAGMAKLVPCLVEVNISGESSKFGVHPDSLAELLAGVLKLEHIKLVGLMTVGPFTQDKDEIRRGFVLLRELRDRAENVFGCYLPHLSMGMSDDYEIAVEEGATMVRLGRVLFGPRVSA